MEFFSKKYKDNLFVLTSILVISAGIILTIGAAIGIGMLICGLGLNMEIDRQVFVALYVIFAIGTFLYLISIFIYCSLRLRVNVDLFECQFSLMLDTVQRAREHFDEYSNEFYRCVVDEFGKNVDGSVFEILEEYDALFFICKGMRKEADKRYAYYALFRGIRKFLRQEASKGHAFALYLYGLTVWNKKKAIGYFRKASDKDWLPATYQIGICYYYGNGVKQDFRKSAEYFKKCVEVEATCYESVTFAKLCLADQYFCGLGIARDVEKADAMYHEIVEHKEYGYISAERRLERSEIPCPKCGNDGYPYKDGKFKCASCKHTFELPKAAKPEKKEEMTAVEINQICAKGFMIVHTTDSDATGNSIGHAGSAFLIAEEGYALTNAHVILNDNNEPCKSIYVKFFEEKIEVKVVAYAIGHGDDMALLKLDHVPVEAKAMSFGDSNILQVGETVYAIGNPCDIGVSFVNGSINMIGASVNGRHNAILTNCGGINHGNSGGPLLNRFGKVIGMYTWSRYLTNGGEIANGLHYAIPSNDLVKFVNDKLDNMGIEKMAYMVKTGRRKVFK